MMRSTLIEGSVGNRIACGVIATTLNRGYVYLRLSKSSQAISQGGMS